MSRGLADQYLARCCDLFSKVSPVGSSWGLRLPYALSVRNMIDLYKTMVEVSRPGTRLTSYSNRSWQKVAGMWRLRESTRVEHQQQESCCHEILKIHLWEHEQIAMSGISLFGRVFLPPHESKLRTMFLRHILPSRQQDPRSLLFRFLGPAFV